MVRAKRRLRLLARIALTALSLLIVSTGRAGAGPVTILPSQQVPVLPPQQAPSALPSPPLTPQREQTIPVQPGATRPPPSLHDHGNTQELRLPEVFRGCWAGTVEEVDSIRPLSSEATHIGWLTKSYRLCYEQIGYAGAWRLTYAESAVADRSQVSDQRQVIKVKSVSGPDTAELTAYLHFFVRPFGPFGLMGGYTLDELSHLRCQVTSDHQAMDVQSDTFAENDGQPEAEITWHTRFHRVDTR